MVLNKDFKEFVVLLNAHKVRYLIVGGYALAYHGHPRYTKDLDIWIESTSENASLLMNVLNNFGFGSVGIKHSDFLDPDHLIILGKEPTRIDLITSIPGLSFPSAYDNCSMITIKGTTIKFLNKSDLITAKKNAGRLQDLADVENLTSDDQNEEGN
ncbi:MAG: nucleotidyltransferase [Deltaproteobacteria bacterium]|nr:nucleotidyltransferase [Deltaproteobacteria bacterium]